jgi:crotonobetainyl-CoA:carnitine CoA-transferase CaiB-like acyl-CoA transferase
MSDPALAARGMVADAALSGGGTTGFLSLPWRIEGGRPSRQLPPPRLGEHTEAFRRRFPG